MDFVQSANQQLIKMSDKRATGGIMSGLVGIVTNLVLFIMKIIIGLSSNSAAILGDAINSLSDFLSSLITVFGFKLSQLPPDREHPYGHARFELISGFVISIVMLYLGIDLLREAVMQIITPTAMLVTRTMFYVLAATVVIKLLLLIFYKKMYKKLESEVIYANLKDSQNDIIITFSIMVGMAVQSVYDVRVDAYLAAIISLLIISSSYTMLKDFVRELLGSRPDEELIEGIQSILDQEEDIMGYHDLIIHSYGVNRHYATVHVEIDEKTSLMDAHDVVDHLEYKVGKAIEVDLVIHLDPLDLDNPLLKELNKKVGQALLLIHEDLSYHDLRLFHNTLIFDVVVAESVPLSDKDLVELMGQHLEEEPYRIKITFDRNYLLD